MVKRLVLLVLFSVIFLRFSSPVLAQVFSLSPNSGTFEAGKEFQVNLLIDTEGKEITSADVLLNFDQNVLAAVRVDGGNFLSNVSSYIASGVLMIGGYEDGTTKSGKGTLAVLTLKGVAGGSGTLDFVCSRENSDSNIFDTEGNDIIVCSGLTEATYSIAGTSSAAIGSDASASQTPSLTPTATPTTAVSAVASPTIAPPQSGVFLPTVAGGIVGFLLIFLGLVLAF